MLVAEIIADGGQAFAVQADVGTMAGITSMLAACVALVSLFSTLPKAFRASCWYVAQARKSIVCFAGRVRRAWAWIREMLR